MDRILSGNGKREYKTKVRRTIKSQNHYWIQVKIKKKEFHQVSTTLSVHDRITNFEDYEQLISCTKEL